MKVITGLTRVRWHSAMGVLEGTVRRLLLEVCEREGIPVVLKPPKLAEAASKWEGALISSTSRLMLPIDELYEHVTSRGVPIEEWPQFILTRYSHATG